MEPSIYSYSLCIALPLMSFFGFYFLLASTPGKAIFNNYLRSRRIMGAVRTYEQRTTIRYQVSEISAFYPDCW